MMFAPLAQLDRASVYGTEGQEFESLAARQQKRIGNSLSFFVVVKEGNHAEVIKPNCKPNGKWALKTEYHGAFPESEIELLNRGWHIAFNKNDNRWAEPRDLEREGNFIKFVSKKFSK